MKTKAQSLIALFGWFQVPPNKPEGTKEKLMAQFEYITRSFTDKAVFNAVEDFVNGRVDGQSGTWLPEPTEFGMRCRVYAAYDNDRAKRERIARESLNALPPPNQQTEKERQAAHAKIMGKANQFFDQIENERVGEAEGGETFKGLTADALGDPRPIEERLNLRDTQAAYYQERETKAAANAQAATVSADDVLNNLGVNVEADPSPSLQGEAQ